MSKRLKLARINHCMHNRIEEGNLYEAMKLSQEYTNTLEAMYLEQQLKDLKTVNTRISGVYGQ